MSDTKLFRLSGSAPVIDQRTGHNATLRPGLVVLSEDAHTHAMATLEAERERLADALDRQSVITGDYIARCQRLADELAITRRVIDRIGQLCTTPHESKERFIRRVQSVIEWQTAAQQDQPR